MANIKLECTWNLAGANNTFALLTLNIGNRTWKLEPTDSNYVPIVLKEITGEYLLLYSEASIIVATELNLEVNDKVLWETQLEQIEETTLITLNSTVPLVLDPNDVNTRDLFDAATGRLNQVLTNNILRS